MTQQVGKLPFESRFTELDGLRIHYLHEGMGSPILLGHGNLSWSYGFRKMIPACPAHR